MRDEDGQLIMEEFNKKAQLIASYCCYFGNAKMALQAHIAELSESGFLLKFKERNSNGFNQVRVLFNQPIRTIEEARIQFEILTKEVDSVLNLKIDRNYVPPGRVTLNLFKMPSVLEFVIVFSLWLILILLVLSDFLPNIKETAASVFIAVLSINISFAIIVFSLGIYSEFPLDILIKNTAASLFFGVITAGNSIKAAYRRREELDKNETIGYT